MGVLGLPPLVVPHVKGSEADRVFRDVTVTVYRVPVYAVDSLFRRIHLELSRPDVDDIEAHLVMKYSGLDETQYEVLDDLIDRLWLAAKIEVTRERIREVGS